VKLSILIATTVDRRAMFDRLHTEFLLQKSLLACPDDVQILWEEDNKEISIGKKRQKLLTSAEGDYIVYFDSDDYPYPYYIAEILGALTSQPDCVGFLIHMTTNGMKPQVCRHSLKYRKWDSNKDGYDYVRGITHFNPVKRSLALKVGFPDLRFGEDKFYSDRVTRLCHREVYIDKKLFHYRYSNAVPHNKKYGIKHPHPQHTRTIKPIKGNNR
jgi:hypothetical protein